jgi:hypothetical protein
MTFDGSIVVDMCHNNGVFNFGDPLWKLLYCL